MRSSDASVVVDDVEAAVRLLGGGDECVEAGAVADVDLMERRFATAVFDLRDGLYPASRSCQRDQLAPAAASADRSGAADTRASTGDDCDFAVGVHGELLAA